MDHAQFVVAFPAAVSSPYARNDGSIPIACRLYCHRETTGCMETFSWLQFANLDGNVIRIDKKKKNPKV